VLQEQPEGAVIVNDPLPPDSGGFSDVGVTTNVHAAAA
jgi:hypothetical protein